MHMASNIVRDKNMTGIVSWYVSEKNPHMSLFAKHGYYSHISSDMDYSNISSDMDYLYSTRQIHITNVIKCMHLFPFKTDLYFKEMGR